MPVVQKNCVCFSLTSPAVFLNKAIHCMGLGELLMLVPQPDWWLWQQAAEEDAVKVLRCHCGRQEEIRHL